MTETLYASPRMDAAQFAVALARLHPGDAVRIRHLRFGKVDTVEGHVAMIDLDTGLWVTARRADGLMGKMLFAPHQCVILKVTRLQKEA